jgi:hypothetical protein
MGDEPAEPIDLEDDDSGVVETEDESVALPVDLSDDLADDPGDEVA